MALESKHYGVSVQVNGSTFSYRRLNLTDFSILEAGIDKSDEMVEVRRAIFSSLLDGRVVSIDDLVDSFGEEVIPRIEELVDGGVAILDNERALIVGAEGISLAETAHRLSIGDISLYTWCAFDIVGIPAALKVDSRGVTNCPTCGRELRFDASRGSFDLGSEDERIVGFWPNSSGPVIANFCPSALIYCSIDHLREHRGGSFDGQALPIEDLASRGEVTWRIFSA